MVLVTYMHKRKVSTTQKKSYVLNTWLPAPISSRHHSSQKVMTSLQADVRDAYIHRIKLQNGRDFKTQLNI